MEYGQDPSEALPSALLRGLEKRIGEHEQRAQIEAEATRKKERQKAFWGGVAGSLLSGLIGVGATLGSVGYYWGGYEARQKAAHDAATHDRAAIREMAAENKVNIKELGAAVADDIKAIESAVSELKGEVKALQYIKGEGYGGTAHPIEERDFEMLAAPEGAYQRYINREGGG